MVFVKIKKINEKQFKIKEKKDKLYQRMDIEDQK